MSALDGRTVGIPRKSFGLARLCSSRPFFVYLVVGVLLAIQRYPRTASAATVDPSTSTGICQTELEACFLNDQCISCTISFDEATCSGYDYDADDECAARGVAYCCGAEASGSVDTCLTDEDTVEYWECIMEYNNCSLSDMPCVETAGSTGEQASTMDEGSGAARGSVTAGLVAVVFCLALASSASGSLLAGLIL